MRLLSNFLIKSSPKSSTFSTRLPPLFAKNISIHGLFSSVYLLIHEHFRKNTKLWTSNSFKPPFKKSCVTNCLFTLSTLDFHIKLKIILSFKWRRYRFIRRGKWNKQTILILQATVTLSFEVRIYLIYCWIREYTASCSLIQQFLFLTQLKILFLIE